MDTEPIADEAHQPPQIDTKHEAHPHAPRRVVLGVLAVIIVFVTGGIIWSYWGPVIEKACFGEQEACEVTLDETNTVLEYDTAQFADTATDVIE